MTENKTTKSSLISSVDANSWQCLTSLYGVGLSSFSSKGIVGCLKLKRNK